jgi:gliding motility-associated-like protein
LAFITSIKPALLKKFYFQVSTQTSGKVFRLVALSVCAIFALNIGAFAQTPSVSYGSGVHTFTVGTPVTLTPTSSNVSAQGYSTHKDTIATQAYTNYSFVIDGKGYLYHAEGKLVTKTPVTGGSSILLRTSPLNVTRLMLDTAGNIYTASGSAEKIPVGGGAIKNYNVASNGTVPDLKGNVYFEGTTDIYRHNGSTVVNILSKDVNNKHLALDLDANMYLVNATDGKLYQVKAQKPTPILIKSGFTSPNWIATDPGNNLYIAGKTVVRQLAPDRSTLTTLVSGLSPGTSLLQSVTLDPKGNMYLATSANPGVSTTVYLQKIAPTGGYHINKILPDGLRFDNNTGIISGTPVSSFKGNFTVYAYNASGAVDSALVTINIPSSNANLANLEVRNNKLGQTFNKDSLNYTITVTNSSDGYSIIYLVPTVSDPNATIKVNGVTKVSGSVATDANLDTEDNIFKIEVTAPDGVTKKTYTVVAHRAQAMPAALHVTFTPDVFPEFSHSGSSYIYTGHPNFDQDTINIRPSVGDPGATITYNGTPITPSAPYFTAHLNVGQNIYPIEVTWPNSEHRTYTIELPRELPDELDLKSFTVSQGTLNPAFTQGVSMYADTVVNSVTNINVSAVAADAGATLTINGTTVTSGSPTVNVALGVGNTSIPVVITSGSLSFTRTIVVTRLAGPTSSSLQSLSLNNIAIPDFDAGIHHYNVDVNYNIDTARVKPQLFDPSATATVNGNSVTAGGFIAVPLAHGANTITVVVTAPGGVSTQTYVVTVNRAISNNNYLDNLTLSEGTPLSPSFNTGTYIYNSTVGPNIASVDITPTAEDPEATIKVYADIVASGTPQNVPLNYGSNSVDIEVTAPNGDIRHYTIGITRLAPTSNNKLYNLTVSTGGLSPYFNPAVHDYAAPAVSNLTTSLNLKATLDDLGAYLKVNGSPATSGSAASVPLSVGDNAIVVTVLAPDSSATNTYTVNVKRAAAGDATLETQRLDTKSLITKVTTSGALNTYSATVSAGTTSVKLAAFVTDPSATLTINGVATASGEESAPIALNPTGTTTITTVVTAPNSATKTYQVVISKTGSSNANLLSQELDTKSVLTKVVTSSTLNTYTATVSMATTSVKLTSVTSDAAAAMTVNGTTVASGTQTGAIALNPTGTTVITTVVTAPDGTTTKTYEITISKTGSGNANLATLRLNTKSLLVKGITTGVLNTYTASVNPTFTTVVQTAIADDSTSTITVNGITVASGAPSPQIKLNSTGTTDITTIVTAAGGATKTYVITISKGGSTDANLVSQVLSTKSTLVKDSTSTALNTYTTSVSAGTTSLTLTVIASDPNASIELNGTYDLVSGTPSPAIPLNPTGTTTITTVVTAPLGNTKTYTIVVSKNGNNNAYLSNISLDRGYYTQNPVGNDYFYTVTAGTTSVKQNAVASDANAVIRVNGAITPSGTSGFLPLNSSGPTVITTVVTAEDGVTTRTYHITVTKASSFIASTNNNYKTVGIINKEETVNTHPDVVVRQAVSPNGDGINDALTIDGLAAYPDNKVSIMDKSGVMVYEQKGYDGTGSFDGRTATGKRLQQGTYFYSVEYRDEKGLQRKTGYLVLKF